MRLGLAASAREFSISRPPIPRCDGGPSQASGRQQQPQEQFLMKHGGSGGTRWGDFSSNQEVIVTSQPERLETRGEGPGV